MSALAEGIHPTTSRLARRIFSLKPVPALPLLALGIIVIGALLASLIYPYSPYEPSLADRLQPPIWQSGGSLSHPLGTDGLGRDMLSRLLFGARASLAVSLVVILAAGVLGTIVGIVSGLLGGWGGAILMRAADATLAFPIILLALLLAVVRGPSFSNVILVVSVVLWAYYARIIRGEVLSLKERDFVALARIAGCSPAMIMARHLLPNVLHIVLVLMTFQLGLVIVIEASLSFLGAGIPPPTPAWGSMVAEGRNFITSAWWVSGLPGLAIMITVLSFSLLGDWLRDTLDPRLRQV